MHPSSLCVQEFTGPSIELSRDGGEVFYGVVAGPRSLPKVLPEQSIGFPIRASLSGACRFAGVPRREIPTAQMDRKSR